MRFIDRRQQRKKLKQNHQRRSECAHQRKPIRGTNHHIEERYRPRDENNDLKEVRDRTTTEGVTTNRQKRGLKNKTKSDRKEIELHWPKDPTPHFENGVRDRHQKTKR